MVRVKRRYLTLQFLPDDGKTTRIDMKERDVAFLLKDIVRDVHGEFGVGSIQNSLQVKKFNQETGIAVVSVQRGPHHLITSSIPFVKKVKDLKCSLQVIYLSGTLRASVKFLIKLYKHQAHEFTKQLKHMKDTDMDDQQSE